MKNLIWKYVKPLKDPDTVHKFLAKHHIQLPGNLITCIIDNNGGRPSDNFLCTEQGTETAFKSLLSYNESDLETIYSFYPSQFTNNALYPLGTDVCGNFICYDTQTGSYILWNHETDKKEIIKLSN